jgi:hypothetical protein
MSARGLEGLDNQIEAHSELAELIEEIRVFYKER